ncbi:DUF1810 domain-containing protein [Aureimonas psammosilenae]|uniref:DUF1810 domain-containing protein n=1 Tax=Aureimonas psammosilenae TaxID=2495496 RepID=UPI001260B2F3|nr:DUF1810 domain-containing protein [Aureimonas psammosilenae]
MSEFDLSRFLDAQAPVIEGAMEELRRGRKTSHWMWFVFPQIAGLGRSSIAQFYAIGSLDEAKAFARHPVLGPRLMHCTQLVNAVAGRSAHEIFGSPDDVKFRSSMTLFERAADDPRPFAEAIDRFFDGTRDEATLNRL